MSSRSLFVPVAPEAEALPRRSNIPGTTLELLVLAADVGHCAGIDLVSGAIVRAWTPAPIAVDLRPYDVIGCTLDDTIDLLPDPTEPEAVPLLEAPERSAGSRGGGPSGTCGRCYIRRDNHCWPSTALPSRSGSGPPTTRRSRSSSPRARRSYGAATGRWCACSAGGDCRWNCRASIAAWPAHWRRRAAPGSTREKGSASSSSWPRRSTATATRSSPGCFPPLTGGGARQGYGPYREARSSAIPHPNAMSTSRRPASIGMKKSIMASSTLSSSEAL